MITLSDDQPIRSANDTAEFRRNYGANEFMNALYALDSGHCGKGVTVGVVDDGVLNVNGELDGRISSLSKDFGRVTGNGATTDRNVLGDENSDHGIAVANIIAGAANGKNTVGYAPNAEIAILRVSTWNSDTNTEELWFTSTAIEHAAASGIKLVNVSLTGGGSAWKTAVTRLGESGGLLINSAGNDGAADPTDAQWVDAANRDAVLFVGALSPALVSYQIETYSNRAGVMKDRYVVAVGSNVTTRVNGTVDVFSGTSSATPVVSGLAADILSKWPQLSGKQAGEIILNTAKDLGDTGVDEVFGRGLVDFKAALEPSSPTLSNGSTQTSLETSIMSVPTAMNARSIQTALSNVTVLDAYGRNYSGSISNMVVQPQINADRRIERRVRAGTNVAEMAFGGFSGSIGHANYRTGEQDNETRSVPTTGSVSYANPDYGVRASWNSADSLQSDVMGLAPFADGVLAYVPQADTSFGVDRYLPSGRFGLTVSSGSNGDSKAKAITLNWSSRRTDVRLAYIDERGTIMGMPTGQGALRLGRGARTVMAEGHQTFGTTGRWSLEGYASVGITRLKIDEASVVTGASSIVGSRIGLQATGVAMGGLLTLGIAQPLRIEAGSARLTYGNGYDLASQSLTYSTERADLAGKRRLQLTTGFETGRRNMHLRVGFMHDVKSESVSGLAGAGIRF